MAWLNLIESAGNHLLSLDPEFLAQLQPFFGRRFRIQIIEPDYAVDLRPCPDGFILETVSEGASGQTADVTLRGSLWAFAQLGKDGAQSDVFAKGRISMEGDAELGQAFQRLLTDLQIDWEELIASLVGDMAARSIHRFAGELKSWFQQSSDHFKQNSGEILQQELGVAPSQVEANALAEQIENLRSDVARLEARLAKLKAADNCEENSTDA